MERLFHLLTFMLFLVGTNVFAWEISKVAIIGVAPMQGFQKFIPETDMISPKSAAFSPDGQLLVVNALEAGKTFAYAVGTWEKVWEVRHVFPASEQSKHLAIIPDRLKGYFDFPSPPKGWFGKPVEMAFTPDGRFLYISSYRKDFDKHGHYASSVSVIDTAAGKIVESLPSGPIPKSLEISPDGTRLIVADWGDNTISVWGLGVEGRPVALVNHFAAGERLNLSGLTGDRDVQCGWCLRGVAITSDGTVAFVSRMSKKHGLDLVDLTSGEYIGFKGGVPASLAYLVRAGQRIYASSCAGKIIARIDEHELLDLDKGKERPSTWRTKNTGSIMRTVTAAGGLIVAALHEAQQIGIFDANTLALIGMEQAPAWPVGACISPDLQWVAVTAQGYKGSGGHKVAVYRVTP